VAPSCGFVSHHSYHPPPSSSVTYPDKRMFRYHLVELFRHYVYKCVQKRCWSNYMAVCVNLISPIISKFISDIPHYIMNIWAFCIESIDSSKEVPIIMNGVN